MSVFVSADSTCDLSPELVEKYGVGIMPLYIQMGDRSLKDGVECTPADIFAHTDATGTVCSTAAVSIADYQDFFAEKLRENDELVHFTISSDMSACYQNALIAAAACPGRVFVVDARNLSTGIGHLVIDAALMAAEGKGGKEISDTMKEKREKLNVSFVLDTLKYLHMGGRCSGVAALGANLLKLRPCIEVVGGKMEVGKKYRGSLEKSLIAYVKDRIEGRNDYDLGRIFITDSGVDDAIVAELADILRAAGFREILHTRAGGTISSHCGPKCLGILYYNT